MPDYRRNRIPGATYFFTVNLLDRRADRGRRPGRRPALDEVRMELIELPHLSVRAAHDKVVRDTVDRILDRKIKYFESAIRDAHTQGLIVAPDPKAKARALFACYHGTLAQARIQNDLELLRDFKHVAMDVLGVKHVHATSS